MSTAQQLLKAFREAPRAVRKVQPRNPTTLGLALKKLTPPVPLKQTVRRVVLSYNKDAHASARHFARDLYPRVAYSNRHVTCTVEQLPKPADIWTAPPPEWVVTSEDGEEKRIPLPLKEKPAWILQQLVDEFGAVPFEKSMAYVMPPPRAGGPKK